MTNHERIAYGTVRERTDATKEFWVTVLTGHGVRDWATLCEMYYKTTKEDVA
jgi:hypothetical protein